MWNEAVDDDNAENDEHVEQRRETLVDVGPQRKRYRVDASLSEALDGVERRAAILVTGPPSAGKSTEIARLVVALGWPTAWLDSEMSRERVAGLLRRQGASKECLSKVSRIGPPRVRTWAEACELTDGAELVVVDSIHEWAATEKGRQGLLSALLELAETRLVIAVQHWSHRGRAAGSIRSNHRVAACVTVTSKTIRVTKSWWAPLREVARAS